MKEYKIVLDSSDWNFMFSEELSLAAKGLWIYLCGNHPGDLVSVKALEKKLPSGGVEILRCLEELEAQGLAQFFVKIRELNL